MSTCWQLIAMQIIPIYGYANEFSPGWATTPTPNQATLESTCKFITTFLIYQFVL